MELLLASHYRAVWGFMVWQKSGQSGAKCVKVQSHTASWGRIIHVFSHDRIIYVMFMPMVKTVM